LVTAVVACLLTASPHLVARDLNGGTATVGAGDPKETWTLSNNATLNIVAGGITDAITADASDLIITDGTVDASGEAVSLTSGSAAVFTRATILSGDRAIAVHGGPANTSATLVDSLVTGNSTVTGAVASTVNNASLLLQGSRITDLATSGAATNAALGVFGGSVGLTAGSEATGDSSGAWMYNDSPLAPTGRLALTVSDSTLTGTNGAGILVGGLTPRGVTVAEILIEQNANVVGGNGRLLEVSENSNAVLTVDDSRLSGGVVVLDTSRADVMLQNAATLTGYTRNVASMSLSNARWQLTEDSDVRQLTVGAGATAALGDGSAFNTLTVTGNYTGGGTLLFNTVLDDDSSASDRLHVMGDTIGATDVAINRVGGNGAETTDGIQIIQVDGASNGIFTLSGRAVGGQYEYFVHKGTVADPTDGSWYLRSALFTPPDPCDADPSLPGCPVDPVDPVEPVDPVNPVDPTDPIDPVSPVDPVAPVDPAPVLRPEPAAYLANQAAAVRMFQQRRHDRGEPAFEHDAIGAWVRVSGDQLHTTIAGQVDARSQISTVQIGSDVVRWGQSGRGQAGIMVATGEANTQASSSLTGYATRGKVKGDAIGIYGTWVQQPTESTGLYVDSWLQYGRYDSQVQGDGLARETYDATTRAASLEAGYGFALSNNDRRAVYLQPQLQVTYTDYKGDTLQEANGTLIEDHRAGGLESRVGVRLFGHDNAEGNRVQPFLAVNWLYSERDNSMRFDGDVLAAKLPTNRYEAQAGAQLRLGERWSAWGDLRVQRGDSGFHDAATQLGLRRAW